MDKKTEIIVFKDVKVRVLRVEDQDYFCITDLAKMFKHTHMGVFK